MSFTSKTFIVQKYDRKGNPGEVIGLKLTFKAAQELSKAHAPAKVIYAMADKTPHPNIPAQRPDQPVCN